MHCSWWPGFEPRLLRPYHFCRPGFDSRSPQTMHQLWQAVSLKSFTFLETSKLYLYWASWSGQYLCFECPKIIAKHSWFYSSLFTRGTYRLLDHCICNLKQSLHWILSLFLIIGKVPHQEILHGEVSTAKSSPQLMESSTHHTAFCYYEYTNSSRPVSKPNLSTILSFLALFSLLVWPNL